MRTIECELQRVFSRLDFTSGYFSIDGTPLYCTLEDEIRSKKVHGETCIPPGRYEVVLQKNLTPLTKRYRKRFKWFKHHLMLKDVPGFSHIYIHIGNDDEDTAGCPLVGYTMDLSNANGWVGKSTQAFYNLYRRLYDKIKKGHKVYITIKNP